MESIARPVSPEKIFGHSNESMNVRKGLPKVPVNRCNVADKQLERSPEVIAFGHLLRGGDTDVQLLRRSKVRRGRFPFQNQSLRLTSSRHDHETKKSKHHYFETSPER